MPNPSPTVRFSPVPRYPGVLADGILLDHERGTVSPCSLENLSHLLYRIPRFGIFGPRTSSISVLVHSVAVSYLATEIARESWRKGETSGFEASSDFVACAGLYSLFHDLGEIFGGDIIRLVPVEARRAFQSYQSWCRAQIEGQLGRLPSPSPEIGLVVDAADGISCLAERDLLGLEFSLDWSLHKQNVLDRLTALGLTREFEGLVLAVKGILRNPDGTVRTERSALRLFRSSIPRALLLVSALRAGRVPVLMGGFSVSSPVGMTSYLDLVQQRFPDATHVHVLSGAETPSKRRFQALAATWKIQFTRLGYSTSVLDPGPWDPDSYTEAP